MESKTNRAFTRSHRSISSAESNRSALTDHAVQENRVISWSAASVIDRESDRSTRWIKEAVHIRKEGPRSMNRDEGSYQLSHKYQLLLMKASDRGRNVKSKECFWLFSMKLVLVCLIQPNETFLSYLKYSETKLPWFSCLLQHSARKRGGLILHRSRAHTGPLPL